MGDAPTERIARGQRQDPFLTDCALRTNKLVIMPIKPMPSIFVSHGAPTLYLEPQPTRRFLMELGKARSLHDHSTCGVLSMAVFAWE